MRKLLNSKVIISRLEELEDGFGGIVDKITPINDFFCDIVEKNEKYLKLILRFHPEIKDNLIIVLDNKKYVVKKIFDLKNGFFKLIFEVK